VGDYLLAIFADRDTCKPYRGPNEIGHVVRVSPNPHMTIVDEFTDGGKFQHEDCGPASLQSWLLDETPIRINVREIERLAGTGLGGTKFDGLIAAARDLGYAVTFSPNPPQPGCVMNPGGFIEGPSAFASYVAASQGGCLVLPDVVTPQPQPIPQEQDVAAVVIRTPPSPDPLGPGAVYLVRDPVYGPKRHITANGDLAGYLAACGQSAPKQVNAYILDRMERGPDIDNSITSPPEA
jgi:hypothetical protein